MLLKPLKRRVRNGQLLSYEHTFKNDNYIEIKIDYYDIGLGFDYYTGDTRKYFYLDFLIFHLELWF